MTDSKPYDSFVINSNRGQIEFDLYRDGEILITTPNYVPYVIDARSAEEIKRRLGLKDQKQSAKANVSKVEVRQVAAQPIVVPNQVVAVCDKPTDPAAVASGVDVEAVACERLNTKIKIDGDGWSAVVGIDPTDPAKEVRFTYSSRAKARNGSPLHKIGEAGRIR